MAIRNHRIMHIGHIRELMKYRGPETRYNDLHGAFVMSGFIDSHVHVVSAARFLEFNIMKSYFQQEFIDRVKNVIQRLESGERILGGFGRPMNDGPWEVLDTHRAHPSNPISARSKN